MSPTPTCNDSHFKVLIVDNDEGPRRAIEAALTRQESLDIRTAKSGEEALKFFESASFDLVLTDIRMPQMDGLALLAKIQICSPKTLVIFITGYGNLTSVIEGIHAGAYDYVTKPFRVEELCFVVQRAIEKIKLLQDIEWLRSELNGLLEKIKRNIVENGMPEMGVQNLELLRDLRRQLSEIYIRNGSNGKE